MVPYPRWTRLLVPLLCLWLLSASCVTRATPQAPTGVPAATGTSAYTTPSPTVQQPETGGTLIVALPAEPDSLNFTLARTAVARWVLSTVDARMVRIAGDGSLQAQLLSSVPTIDNGGITDNGQVYKLHFRDGLQWSDGEPLDARDFLFTWRTITDPAYPAASRAGWDLIQGVEISDDRLTAVVRLRQPSAAFFDDVIAGSTDTGGGFLLPEHVLGDLPVAEIPSSLYSGDKHVGSGPFEVAKWTPGEQLVVERNSRFAGTRARLDRIVFRPMPNPRQALGYLTTGEVDVAVRLPESSLAEVAQVAEAAVLVTPRAGVIESYAFNLDDPNDLARPHPIFSDPAVRQAIAFGFNRQAVAANTLLGHAKVAITPLDQSPWASQDLAPYPFDPEKAVRLLDAAGWRVQSDGIRAKGGTRLSFSLTTVLGDAPGAALRRQVQDAFVSDMRAIGIQVIPRNYTSQEITDPAGILATRRFDMIDLSGERVLDPSSLAWRFGSASVPTPQHPGGGNVMGYRNAVVDQLINQQAGAADPATRRSLLNNLQRRIYEDLPLIPLYDLLEIDVARQYVQGLNPGSASGLWWNPEEWWVDRKGATP